MTTSTTDADSDAPNPKGTRAATEAHWKNLCAITVRFERKLLELMAHPDTTPELLTDAHTRYAELIKSMKETCCALEERYPKAGKNSWVQKYWEFQSLNGTLHRCELRRRT